MVKMVEIRNRKGKALRGFITIPEGAEKCPILLNLHGFSGDKSGKNFSHISLSRRLLEEGIACARFDFYGSGESDGEFEEVTFTSEFEDTIDIYEYLKKQDYVDTDNIFLSGHSMGGFLAASLAPKLSPKALILMCPGASMWYGCSERYADLASKGVEFADIEGLKFNIEFYNDLKQYSPFEDAKGYDSKVMLIWGNGDKLVDRNTCQKYLDIYKENCTFIEIEGADHNFGNLSWRNTCISSVVDFVKNNI